MRIVCSLLLLQLFLPAAYAADVPSILATPFEFDDLWFGDPPPPELVCIWGRCLAEVPGREPVPANNPLSSYVRPRDTTHIERVKIAPPEYFFHADRLFQIGFQLLCPDSLAEFCMQTMEAALDRRFGLELIARFPSPEDTKSIFWTYRTPAGARVTISRKFDYPYVKIYDPALIEAVRRSANPDYSANPFP